MMLDAWQRENYEKKLIPEIKHANIVQTLVDGVYKRNCSNCNCDVTQLTSWFSPRYCIMCGAKFDSK